MDLRHQDDQMSIQMKTKNHKPLPVAPNHVYFLIVALALENLLKCIYLNRHPEIIKDGKIDNGLFKTHELLQIATQGLDLSLSDDEKFLLDFSAKAILWFGRYPIPLKEKDTIGMIQTNTQKIHFTFQILFDRLHTIAMTRMPHHDKLD